MVLDTSPYPTRQDAEAQDIVLRRKDANGAFSAAMTQELADVCQRLGLRYGYKDAYIEHQNKGRAHPYPLGRTELGRIAVATEGAINGSTLQLPTTDYHTAHETASLQSIAAVLRMLTAYV